jgi:hypothetical protein
MLIISRISSWISHQRWLIAPLLAALYPALSLYSQTIRDANIRDAAICAVVIMFGAIAVAFLFRFVFGNSNRASIAAVAFIAWCFAFSPFLRGGKVLTDAIHPSPYNDYILFFLWVCIIFPLLFLWWRFRWTDRRLEQLDKFLVLAGAGAVIICAAQGVHAYWHLNKPGTDTVSVWANDREPVPANWKPVPRAEKRDVYYLLFDRYGSEKTLQKFFGFDNSKFYDELEKRGFLVDRDAVTSYPMTSTAMASTLNMRYLGQQVENNSDYFAMVQSNEVGKLFREAGYKYYFFGNQYDPLRKSSIADWNMKISMLPSEFADSLVNLTPFRPLIGRQHKHQFTQQKFAAVADLAKTVEPKFVYSHFLVPHPPYAFARDGSAQTELNRASRPEQELYIDQLVATNRLILQMVDRILNTSRIKPIIILQADEGPYLMSGDERLSRDEQIEKRTGILNAILIPDDDVRRRLPKPLMPVNTFRFLFEEYFGAPIDLLPNRVFYWEAAEPTGAAAAGSRIIDVTREMKPNS